MLTMSYFKISNRVQEPWLFDGLVFSVGRRRMTDCRLLFTFLCFFSLSPLPLLFPVYIFQCKYFINYEHSCCKKAGYCLSSGLALKKLLYKGMGVKDRKSDTMGIF